MGPQQGGGSGLEGEAGEWWEWLMGIARRVCRAGLYFSVGTRNSPLLPSQDLCQGSVIKGARKNNENLTVSYVV